MTYVYPKHYQSITTEPMYLSETHGLLSISKMDTQHLKNALCKRFRQAFAAQPYPIREVFYILLRSCNNNLPNSKLSSLVAACCETLDWHDETLNYLITELSYRENSTGKVTEDGGGLRGSI